MPVSWFAILLLLLIRLVVPIGSASAQGFGSPGVQNIGPPEDALFPGFAALQDRLEEQGWLLRGQATFIWQGHPRFRSPYRGEGSLSPAANARNTFSSDLVLGRKLWSGAEAVIDASVTRGFGLSNSTGVAAFPEQRGVPARLHGARLLRAAGVRAADDRPVRRHGARPRPTRCASMSACRANG